MDGILIGMSFASMATRERYWKRAEAKPEKPE
jgi:hypothetical protein